MYIYIYISEITYYRIDDILFSCLMTTDQEGYETFFYFMPLEVFIYV